MEYLTDRILFSKIRRAADRLNTTAFFCRNNCLNFLRSVAPRKPSESCCRPRSYKAYRPKVFSLRVRRLHSFVPIGYCRTTLDLSRKSRFHIPGQSRRCPGKIILQLPAFSYLDLYLRHPVIVRKTLSIEKNKRAQNYTIQNRVIPSPDRLPQFRPILYIYRYCARQQSKCVES